MLYDELTNSVREGSVISFKEYTLDRHERRHISIQIDDAVVYRVIPTNKQLSREELEELYGTELDDIDYQQLSCMNCIRFVLNLGVQQDGSMDIKIIVVNKYFYETKLQEVELLSEIDSENLYEPNYLAAQKFW